MKKIRVTHGGIHCGEEPIVEGNERSGLINLTGCHLRCTFCYSPELSSKPIGDYYSQKGFFLFLKSLINRGARNINLVSPTLQWNVLNEPVAKVKEAYPTLPIILNFSGYENTSTIRSYCATGDILVPDFKVWDSAKARSVGLPANYGKTALNGIESAMQTHGATTYSRKGRVTKAILTRILMMPGFEKDAFDIIRQLSLINYRQYVNFMTRFVDNDTHSIKQTDSSVVNDLVSWASHQGIRPLIDGRIPSLPEQCYA